MSTLIIAEKPDQARAYMDGLGLKHKPKDHVAKGQTFLDPTTTVIGARGHLIELSEPEAYGQQFKDRTNLKELPLFPSKFLYDIPKENSFLFSEIRNEIGKADRIIVATDKDNEGAAIAFNIIRFSNGFNKKIFRAYPSSLDKKAIQNQFRQLEPIAQSWREAMAAIARSRSDWLIGMNLSRLYTTKLANEGIIGNYAIGRAITATLSLICIWNANIANFKKHSIYTLKAMGEIDGQDLQFISNIKTTGSDKLLNPKKEYISLLKKNGFLKKQIQCRVANISSDIKEMYPPILLTKGSLYKAMDKAYGWSQAKSKNIMQKNYEDGYQTYPRTDSGLIAKNQYEYLKKLIPNYLAAIHYTEKFIPYQLPDEKLKKYLLDIDTNAAHQGIIPSEKIMDDEADVTEDQRKMYDVVVRHTLTIFQSPYKYVSNVLKLQSNDVTFITISTGLVDIGWKKLLLSISKQPNELLEKVIEYSKYFRKDDIVNLNLYTDISETKPLPLLKQIQIYDGGGLMENAYKYVENKTYASILKKVKGIGTSATRDTILESLINKKYIYVDKKDQIHVTPNGWLINKLFNNSIISSPVLTAKWETAYKKIAEGGFSADNLINATVKLVQKEFQRVQTDWNSIDIQEYYKNTKKKFDNQISIGQCPQCNSPVIYCKDIKNKGKYNAFRCSNKECNFVIFERYWNKKISEKNIKRLLNRQYTTQINGIKSTSDNKTYSAILELRYSPEKKRQIIAIKKKINTKDHL